MSEVFISYARSTETQARQIAEALQSLGYGVWRDDELPAHRAYSEVIEERLKAASAVLVIWSAEAAKSQWVRAEADLAREAGTLVQLTIDGTAPPMPFNQIHSADLSAWSGEAKGAGWRKVLASINELVGPLATAPGQLAIPTPASGAAGPLLAVLPFDNLSGDADLLYFSDGVSEEILQTVVQTTGLNVIGRSSSFQYRGPAKAAQRVAAELGCTHVLDGSVRRSGARVRISASLIECARQTALWSDRFDRDLSDVFALQDEIAAAVATALKAAFSPSPDVGPIDPVAYDLYLRARASTPGRLGAFDAEQLRQATTRAPRFAQAWAALAITRATQAANAEGERLEAARPEAFEAAHKALALDSKAGTAYVALALLEPYCGRFQEVETLFNRALAVSPDDQIVLERFSRWLHGVGRSGEALAHITRAFGIDPLYHQGANWYATMIALEGRLDEAFEVWDSARERWPTFDVLTFNPMLFAVGVHDWKQVDKLFVHIEDHGVDSDRVRDVASKAREARHKTQQAVEDPLGELRDQLRDTGTIGLSKLLAAYHRGGRDEAFDIVERASFDHLFQPSGRLSHGDYGLHVLFNGSQPIHSDPRFVGLCAKLGLCDFWASTDRWPDCAARVASVYDFKAEARRLTKRVF